MTSSGTWPTAFAMIALAALSAAEVAARPVVPQNPNDPASLFHRDPSVREEAVRALPLRGDMAVPDALRALFDDDRRVRAAAIEALKDIGGDRAAEALAAAVHDTDARLRENAVYAAARIGGPAARLVVELVLADPVEPVREAARQVLSEFQAAANRGVKNPVESHPPAVASTGVR